MESCKLARRFSNERCTSNNKRIFKTSAEEKISNEIAEKQVVNSLTELIDSKKDGDFKSNVVMDVLVEKIVARLLDSHAPIDKDKCYSTARKMATFVADIMRETYRRQRKSNSHFSEIESKSTLPIIPENKILEDTKNNNKESPVPKSKTPPKFETKRPSLKQIGVSVAAKAASKRQALKSQSEVRMIPKTEREKLNTWLDEVSETTGKWTKWIQHTVKKAEEDNSKRGKIESTMRHELEGQQSQQGRNVLNNDPAWWLDSPVSNLSFASTPSNDSIRSNFWSPNVNHNQELKH